MRYRLLGRTGLRVAEICLGTMTFGEDWGWGSSQQEARQIYDAYLEAGGNFIDTANIYTNGTSERFLAEFIKDHRERIVLATKYTNSFPLNDANSGGNQRKNMMQAVEASLKRLQTDYIDLYWLHCWDKITPIDEVMRAFDDLVRQGKVLHIGISDAPAWVVAKSNTMAELRAWTPYASIQIEYSLCERTPERELLPMARDYGITVTAWSPLAGGILSGKYLTDKPDNARYSSAGMQQVLITKTREERIALEVNAVAKECGRSAAQVALAWLRYRDQPIIPIIGARKLTQLQDNLASLDLKLDEAHLTRLDNISRVDLGFPHEFYQKDFVRAGIYGGMADKIDM